MIERPGLLSARYIDRSGTRTSGWFLFGISGSLALAGGVGGLSGFLAGGIAGFSVALVSLVVGGLNLLLATAVGLPLAAIQDRARITFD